MIDNLMSSFSKKSDSLYPENYSADVAVTGDAFQVVPGSSELAVLFPPWHGGGKFYELLANRLVRAGSSVLSLSFHDQMLTVDPHEVLESFRVIQSRAAKRINDIAAEYNITNLHLIAASLGTPALAMTAGVVSSFSKATMIVPGSNLAKCFWNGSRTRHYRYMMQDNGLDIDTVNRMWNSIAPVNHIESLRGKEISVVVSTNDRIIPTRYQVEYVDALKGAGIDPDVRFSRFGHYATVGKYCLSAPTD